MNINKPRVLTLVRSRANNVLLNHIVRARGGAVMSLRTPAVCGRRPAGFWVQQPDSAHRPSILCQRCADRIGPGSEYTSQDTTRPNQSMDNPHHGH
jgi:hypothetical protein